MINFGKEENKLVNKNRRVENLFFESTRAPYSHALQIAFCSLPAMYLSRSDPILRLQ